jgi:hypothetical protein
MSIILFEFAGFCDFAGNPIQFWELCRVQPYLQAPDARMAS